MATLTNEVMPRIEIYTVGATATTGPFRIPFPFQDPDTVRVFIGGTETFAFTITGTDVTLGAAVSNTGVSIMSDTGALRTLGETFVQAELSKEVDRIFALFQEVKEFGFFTDPQAASYEFRGRRLTKIADPVAGDDAASKSWVQGFLDGAVVDASDSAAAAATSAGQASDSASAASASASAAAGSASAAAASATAAGDSETAAAASAAVFDQSRIWTFESVAAMQAEAAIPSGAIAMTAGYAAAGDGGGNEYRIVDAATYTADGGSVIDLAGSGLQAVGLFPGGIRWQQFGCALTALVVDDTARAQALLDYVGTLGATVFLDSRGAPDGQWKGPVQVDNFLGRVMGLSAPLVATSSNRNTVFNNFAAKAIGAAWVDSDFMFKSFGGMGTWFVFNHPRIDCSHICGGIEARADTRIFNPVIRSYSGIGISAAGARVHVYDPCLWEWSPNDNEFYDEANYTGTAFLVDYDDARVFGGFFAWSKILVDRANSVNSKIVGTHLFNGMEGWRDHNKDGSLISANPAGTPAVGRSSAPLVVTRSYGTTGYRPLFLEDVYLDSGTIDLYDDEGFHLIDAVSNANSNISPASYTHLINNYAKGANQPSRIVVKNLRCGVNSIALKAIRYLPDPGNAANTWGFDSTAWEASAENILNARNSVISIQGDDRRYSTAPEVVRYFGQGPNAKVSVRDKDSTQYWWTGTEGNLWRTVAGSAVAWTVGGAERALLNSTFLTLASGVGFAAAGMDMATFAAGSDAANLMTGSTNGTLFRGPSTGHVVFGLRDNDSQDAFAIISGGGNYTVDGIFDKLVFRARADGLVEIPGSLNVGGAGVVSRGANANGTWIKFYDGTMICKRVNFTTALNAVASWIFPEAFVDAADVVVTHAVRLNVPRIVTVPNVTASQADIRSFDLTGSENVNPNVDLQAIGRWK